MTEAHRMLLHARRLAVVLALAAAAGIASLATAADPVTGLRAEYFDAPNLTGSPVVTRIDQKVDFDWGLREPVRGVGDTFSVRWKGTIAPRFSERYRLSIHSDDGVRLFIDGQPVIDNFRPHAAQTHHADVNLTAGRKHDIEIEYHDIVRHALIKLEWRSASQRKEVVPSDRLAPPENAPAPVGATADPVDEVAPGTPATTTAVPPPPAASDVAGSAGAATVAGSVLPPPAPPVAGETFNAEPAGGEVMVRRPGDGALIPLEAGASLPVGTRLDTREGSVDLQTAPAASGAEQVASFGGATFRVSQPRTGSNKVVEVDLMHGDFESCSRATPRAKRIRARAAAKRRKSSKAGGSVRGLWGSGKGRFKTRGRHAAATVRGTVWSVVDFCDSTVVKVKEGVVDVEDFTSGKTHTVRAGESHVARPR